MGTETHTVSDFGSSETPKIYSERMPLAIKINGKEFQHFTGFSITRTLHEFIDSFELLCNNPAGKYSLEFMLGMPIQVYSHGIEIFRGVIEGKEVQWGNVGSVINISGREEIAFVAEDDVDPSLGPFENTTDNEILKFLLSGQPYVLQFDPAATIKKYEMSPGSSRKSEIIQEVARFNNFYVWKRGANIFKKKLPSTFGAAKKRLVFAVGKDSKGRWTNEIMDLKITEDIQGVRSKISASGYTSDKKKEGTTTTIENEMLKNGNYNQLIRNVGGVESTPINRTRYAALPSTDKAETAAFLKQGILDVNIKATIVITLAGFHDLDLTDLVELTAEPEGIQGNQFYVSQITYSLAENNKRATILVLTPLGNLPT